MKTNKEAAKTTKTETVTTSTPTSQPEVKPMADAPVLTPDLIARLRAADWLDSGLKLLQPDAKPRVKSDATYELNATCAEPLPQKRGACLKVVAVAARMNAPFKSPTCRPRCRM